MNLVCVQLESQHYHIYNNNVYLKSQKSENKKTATELYRKLLLVCRKYLSYKQAPGFSLHHFCSSDRQKKDLCATLFPWAKFRADVTVLKQVGFVMKGGVVAKDVR